MRISKRHLQKIIRQERRRLYEDCHVEPAAVAGSAPGPTAASLGDLAGLGGGVVVESEAPETDMLVEMEDAAAGLQLVVESVQAAAQLCHECVPEVAAQAPIMEALSTQAQALQEMLEAQVEVIAESVDPGAAAAPILGGALEDAL